MSLCGHTLVAARLIGTLLSRASLPTAQTMMADLRSTRNRAAATGLIGAAIGLGVVCGPALCALLAVFGWCNRSSKAGRSGP